MNKESKKIIDQILKGEISLVCPDCAAKHRDRPPYEGVYTSPMGTCGICKETKAIGPAVKLFGFYRSF